MIFCGDTLLSTLYEGPIHLDTNLFWEKPKFVNFESSINLKKALKVTKGIALQSDPSVVEFFKSIKITGVSIANNHFFDFPISATQQKAELEKHGIFAIGAGENLEDAAKPFISEKENVAVLAFGWNVIRCKYAKVSAPGVNPLEYEWVEKQVKKYRTLYPTISLVVVFHWNYEFEQYPQPADREFAHHLIDLGVDAIIGHHAHIIQGFEIHHRKPIFYGLGNFYFPNGIYSGHKIQFPDISNKGLSVEILDGKLKTYITELVDNRYIKVIEETLPEKSHFLRDLSQFQNMTQEEYIEFFKENRHKRKALPIYKSYKNKIINEIFDKLVIYRQIPVDLIAKTKNALLHTN